MGTVSARGRLLHGGISWEHGTTFGPVSMVMLLSVLLLDDGTVTTDVTLYKVSVLGGLTLVSFD